MGSGEPAQHGIVPDLDVTGKRRHIGENRVVADLERGRFTGVFLVLGGSAERAESVNPILNPYASSSLDQHVRPDRGPLPYLDVLADDRIGSHRYSRGELRSAMNDCRRVNHIGRSVHKIFASAASASPTRACAANFQSPRALRSTATSSRSWSPGTTGRLNRASSIPAK